MNPYLKQQVDNMVDIVNILAKGCDSAALKDDLSIDMTEQYTVAEIKRLAEEFVKGLKKIY